jgi:hypothetical protein
MSIIGQRIAIVSLGSSCQTAQQLRLHAQPISEMVGDELIHDRLPFDWVISPIGKTTEWLRSGKCFPASPSDLMPVPDYRGVFLWRELGIYFWHDFWSSGDIDLTGTFEYTRNQYERGFAKFHDLRKLDRVVLVVANTQNNLPVVLGSTYSRLGFDFTAANLSDLKNATEGLLGRKCELLCVTYADRSSEALHSMPEQDIVVAKISHDASAWEGEPAVWKPLLLAHLSSADANASSADTMKADRG